MAKQSLLKNTDSIGNIRDSINAFGKSLRAANNTSSVIIRKLNESNRSKKGAIGKERMLYQKRRSAVRMREKEDVIEASKVSGIFRRTSKVIGDSTKGFLGRIMDFLGTIIVGWVVTNLPVIIDTVEDLIVRIQKAAGVLTGWFEGTRNFFTGFTSELGNVLSRVTGVDLEGDKKQAEEARDDVLAGSRQVENDFNRMEEMIRNFDLIESLKGMLGLDTEDPKKENKRSKGTQGSGQSTTQGSQGQQTEGGEQYSEPETGSGQVISGQQLYQYLRSKNISHNHALGITANVLGESGFKIDADEAGDGSKGIGLFQYTFPSRKEAFLQAVPDYKTNWKGQVDFAIGEGTSPQYFATNFKSAEEAAEWWMNNWERPAASVKAGRRKKHNNFIKNFRKPEADIKSPPKPAPPPKIESYNKGQDVTSILGSGSTITSLRGNRTDPISGKKSFHNGIDIGCAAGLYIALRVDAEIDGYGVDDGYGQVVDLWVPSLGVQLRFAHNSRVLIKSAGSKVPAGTSFAITGSTGRSTAPHIHFEADTTKGRTAYKTPTSINPAPYVNLIMLTKANIEGRPTSIPNVSGGKGGPQIEGTSTRGSIASNVTPEGKPSTIEVPMPMGGSQSQPQTGESQGGGKSMNMKPDVGNELNSFISKVLLTELANV
jgi:murein DD-endopeptidase MepM/ murein hydrolase activator NlpD